MKTVLLLALGDTIAHRRGSVATGAELVASLGTLPVRVVAEDLMAEPSWDVSTGTMLAVARRVRSALVDDEFAGVVVSHGVDNLGEMAFLTDLLVSARGGIVFTGAFQGWDASGSDGPRNLADSLVAAGDPVLARAGALVCLDGKLHPARTFALGGAPVLDLDELPERWPEFRGEPETDVALLRVYPELPSAVIDTLVDRGARAIVLEGTGRGSVPVELFGTIGGVSSWDIPVVVAGRGRGDSLGAGMVQQMGAISARWLSAGHARIATMVALGNGGGAKAVAEWFDRI
ncbi:asparaginase domain-containing protein [Actinocrispum sp. NPDC049592]|uniref:asparaginase n=1 Tax=Actinocrispum sp. NPDC049592 TaxID=3154835 RepID=UPI0034227F38